MPKYDVKTMLPNSGIVYITGRPSSGKSTLLSDISLRVRCRDGNKRPLVGISKKFHEDMLSAMKEEVEYTLYDATFPCMNDDAIKWLANRDDGAIIVVDDCNSIDDILTSCSESNKEPLVEILGSAKLFDNLFIFSVKSATVSSPTLWGHVDTVFSLCHVSRFEKEALFKQWFQNAINTPELFEKVCDLTKHDEKTPAAKRWVAIVYDKLQGFFWYRSDMGAFKMEMRPAEHNPVQ